jgi:hypothetical protein
MKPTKPDIQLTRRSFIRNTGLAASGLVFLPVSGSGFGWLDFSSSETILMNPTSHDFINEPVRLKIPPPGPAGSFRVMNGNAEISYQIEEINGRNQIWVGTDFRPGSNQQFQVISGQAATFQPKVGLRQDAEYYILENKNVAVKIPARSGNTIPGPIASVKLANGNWIGNSFWKTKKQLKKYLVTVVGDGTVFGKLRLRYEFEGNTGANNNIPAFSEIEIMLAPEWEHFSISEKIIKRCI